MAGLPYRASVDDEPLPGLNDDVPLPAGTLLRLRTTGGGGWGEPFEREPELVLQDVLRGLVSVESAERDYGVIVREGRIIDLRRPARQRPFVDRGPGYEEMRSGTS
jgi:N-methylhydantoinase B